MGSGEQGLGRRGQVKFGTTWDFSFIFSPFFKASLIRISKGKNLLTEVSLQFCEIDILSSTVFQKEIFCTSRTETLGK